MGKEHKLPYTAEDIEERLTKAGTMPGIARVGQYLRVKEVDENGKIKDFEAVDIKAELPTAYLYNGVELPQLPQWDTASYPYAVIDKTSNFSGKISYRLQLLDGLPYVRIAKTTGKIYYKPLEGGHYIYRGTNRDGEAGNWDYDAGRQEFDDMGIYADAIAWCNADIFYEDGNIYLEKSDPEAVYAETGTAEDGSLDFQLQWFMFAEKVPMDGTPVRINDSIGDQLSNIAGNGMPFAATVDIDAGEGYGLRISGVFTVGGEIEPDETHGVRYTFAGAVLTYGTMIQIMLSKNEDAWELVAIIQEE